VATDDALCGRPDPRRPTRSTRIADRVQHARVRSPPGTTRPEPSGMTLGSAQKPLRISHFDGPSNSDEADGSVHGARRRGGGGWGRDDEVSE